MSESLTEPGNRRGYDGPGRRFFPSTVKLVLGATFFALVYFLAAWVGGSLLIRSDRIVVFWPPSGILLAALLLNRPRDWPALLFLVVPAGALANWLNGSLWLAGIGYATATCVGALASAWLLRRGCRHPITLSRTSEVLALVGAAVACALLTATLGAAVNKWQFDAQSYWYFWRNWFASDTMGVLAFTPPALAWVHGGWTALRVGPRRRIVEEVVLLTAFIGLFMLTLSQTRFLGNLGQIRNLIYPLLLLTAIRFGTRGISTAMVVLASMTVWYAANDLGSFAVPAANAWLRILMLQVVTGTVFVAGLLLAASFAERQVSRGALQLSEERYRLLIQQSPYCVHEIDRRGRFLSINPAGLRMLAAEDECAVVGTPYLAAVDVADRAAVTVMLNRAWSGETVEFEFRGGNQFELQSSVAPLVSEDGQVLKLMGLTHDVTRRNQAESRLRDSEQRLRLGLEAARMYSWVWNLATHDVVYSDTWDPASGLPYGQTQRSFAAFLETVHADDRPRIEAAIAAAVNDGAEYRVDFRMVMPHGAIRWISVAGTVLHDREGRATQMIGVSVDITERKTAEDALRRGEELFRLAIDTSRIGVFTQDRDFRFTWVHNPSGRLTAEELVGRSDAELFTAEDAARLAALKRPVLEDGASVRQEIVLAVHGENRVFDLHCDPLRDAAGAVVGITGAARDITSRRRTEAELERHREHLEDLVRLRTDELEASQQRLRQAERLVSIGTLAAGIAHEINNPVGTMLLSAEIALADDDRDPNKIRRCLETIRDDAQRCGRIVKSVLQFAKQETLEKHPHDVNEVVRRSLAATYRIAEQRGAILHVDLTESVVFAQLNLTAMEHAVVNLINNALEASPVGGRVCVSTQLSDRGVSIAVRDDGVGIAPQEKVRVFDPFFTTKQEQGGTGLGLSLAHGIVTEHGGAIRVDSRPGAGATFTIELPRYVAQETAISSNGNPGGPR